MKMATTTKETQKDLWFNGEVYNKPVISLCLKKMDELARAIESMRYGGLYTERLVAEKDLEVEKIKAEFVEEYIAQDILPFLDLMKNQDNITKIKSLLRNKIDFLQMQREVWKLKTYGKNSK